MTKTKKARKSSHSQGQRKKTERIELKLESRPGSVYLVIVRNPRWNHVSWGELLMSEDDYYYGEFLKATQLEECLSQIMKDNKARLGRSWRLFIGSAFGHFSYLPEDLVEPVSTIVLECMKQALDKVETGSWIAAR